MTNFNINIVSDTACPWCYVGKKRLERAIRLYREAHPGSNDTFSISWAPFYLNPDAPSVSVDKRERMESRFGAERTKLIHSRLEQAGQVEGIDFKFGGRTGNTRDSHRLIQLGKTKSEALQTSVVEDLFTAYFENEEDITSHATLASAGVRAGLDEQEVKDWLATDKGGPEVDEEVRQAQQSFISGVPYFTIQDRHHVEGAQEPHAFLEIFDLVKS